MLGESLFEEALSIPPDERAAFLDLKCQGRPELRTAVDALFANHDEASDFLEKPLFVAKPKEFPAPNSEITSLFPSSEPNIVIAGRYTLLEKIGEGGMGEVWVAKQTEPVKRRVALKLIKAGMDSKAVLARFEQERQALAVMDHPNIARVFDGGMTSAGLPFFVMELVNGLPLNKYCDDARLTPNERLELFVQICHAVQHAHQKGIIHRDLNPANILVCEVDGNPDPKVIDYGVAKATAGKLTEDSMFTQFGAVVGTLEYMSPEQAGVANDDIDTRADIYSLGVILYELLTGLKPIDAKRLKSTALLEMIRVIKEEEPKKPSTRLSTDAGLAPLAERRQTDPRTLTALLRGDLDCVVMKCLEKNRSRRYDTANGLAADIRRHLAHEPVLARPPSTAYRLQKAWQRNKLACTAACAVAAALVIGIAASLWQAQRAQNEAAKAKEAQQRTATALAELRATAPVFVEQARALAAKEKFAEAIEKIDYALKLQPESAEFFVAKADLLQCQLKLAEAADVYRQALRVKSGFARAEASLKLCDELLAAPRSEKGRLTRESLVKLYAAMQQQQRPAAELMPVARLVGEERKLLMDYWLMRLADLTVSASRPLKDRLKVSDDGRLALDLSDTAVVDLAPLAGAPISALYLSRCKKLADLTPLRGINLSSLDVNETNVSDLSPLSEMHSLTVLNLDKCKVTDLSPLSGLRLKFLYLEECGISDLAPLRNMPLEGLNLRDSPVSDLSPLAGMPIQYICLTSIPVEDFSPLATFKMKKCMLQNVRIGDLSVLRGQPLTDLVLNSCTSARNFAVLSEFKDLEFLMLPDSYRSLPEADYTAIGALRNHPKLRQLGAEIVPGAKVNDGGSKDVFWKEWDQEQAYMSRLRKSGIKFSITKAPSEYIMTIYGQVPVRDLSILNGMPITHLDIQNHGISDLSPLRDLPLERLYISRNPITDLSPLRGSKIKVLDLGDTNISDLTPLTGLPLQQIYLGGCNNLQDVSPLAQIPTLALVVIPAHAVKVETLRKLPLLATIGYSWDVQKPAAVFWKEYDSEEWLRKLRSTGIPIKFAGKRSDGTWKLDLWMAKNFTDLSLLKGAPISELSICNTGVTDLRPLAGLPLEYLDMRETKVTDLSPLGSAPLCTTLKSLLIWRVEAADFTPLAACTALENLDAADTRLEKLDFLRGRKLRSLKLTRTKVTDLSVLDGMPLELVTLMNCPVTDLGPLLKCQTLKSLTLPRVAKNVAELRTLPALVALSMDQVGDGSPNKTADEFWREFDASPWLAALRDAGFQIKNKKPFSDGTWELDLSETTISDLTPLKGAPVSRLILSKSAVTDLTPLRGMPLKWLIMEETNISDLSPLKGMQLEQLWCSRTLVADLSALKGMPLKGLRLGGTRVNNLEPLRGMWLQTLYIWGITINDPSFLEGMPLEDLWLGFGKFDLSVLRGMPLKKLKCHDCSAKTDVSPLADLSELTSLTVPAGAQKLETLRSLRKLERIGYKEDWTNGGRPDHTAAEFWKEFESNPWITQLRKAGINPRLFKRLDDGTWEVDVGNTGLADFAILQGAPISILSAGRTAVVDLSPLRGMPLKSLVINDTKVTDLSPLGGMPLESLHLGATRVANLEPLRGLRLKALWLCDTEVTDLSPLKDMPLQLLDLCGAKVSNLSVLAGMPLIDAKLLNCNEITDLSPLAKAQGLRMLTLPPHAKTIEFLRTVRTIEQISYTVDSNHQPDKTAEAFWKEYDTEKWLRSLRESGVAIQFCKKLADGTWDLDLSGSNISHLELLRGVPVSSLNLAKTDVTDLSPLRGQALKSLILDDTAVADLSPLQGMPLEVLRCDRTPISTILPLKGTRLKTLSAGMTGVTDLEPLRGMPIQSLNLYGVAIKDLSPLRGMPLQGLWLGSGASDLSVLRGMPLVYLKLHDCHAKADVSPLADAVDLLEVSLPPDAANFEVLRALPRLQRISFTVDWKNSGRPDLTAAEFWDEYDAGRWLRELRKTDVAIKSVKKCGDGTWELDLTEAKFSDLTLLSGARISGLVLIKTAVTDLSPLRGMALKSLVLDETQVIDLRPLQGMPLENLWLNRTPVSDITALKGMNLKTLCLGTTGVTDLEPLRGMPLQKLEIWGDPITDLTPLRGMPLEDVWLGVGASDLSVLRGMPLKMAKVQDCAAKTDVSPLAGMHDLTSLVLRPDAVNIESLRGLPKLDRIGFSEDWDNGGRPNQTAAEFWKLMDARKN